MAGHAPKRLVILGAGGNCRDLIDIALDINRTAGEAVYEPVGYLDDDPDKQGLSPGGVPVLGPLSLAGSLSDCVFVNGINGTRWMPLKAGILAGTGIPAERFATLIHPTAAVSQMARVGRGVALFQNVTVCSNASIGDHVAVLPNAVATHDCEIADLCYLTAGVALAGHVRVERAAYLGSNSSVMCRKTIGAEAIVGMGSVVLDDVPPGAVVAGNPARLIRMR